MERWRPVIKEFTDWAKDSNLAKVTKKQVIDWKNVLLQQDVRVGRDVKKRAPRTVKDVHLAALKAVCQYLVDEDKLTINPVAGVVVRNVETEKDDDEKGFSDKDARTIAWYASSSTLVSATRASVFRPRKGGTLALVEEVAGFPPGLHQRELFDLLSLLE